MRSYASAIFVSLIGHGLLVWFVIWGWGAAAEKPVVKKPVYIKATLVQLEQKAKPVVEKIKKTEPPKVDNTLKQKQVEEAKKKKQLEQQAARQREAKKAAEETARKNQLAKKREEEKKQQAIERKKKEEQEKRRKAELLKEVEVERQRELERTIAVEKARLEKEKQAAADAELAQSYHSVIHDKVSANWSRPPSARNGMSALLRIQLVPTGKVISVDVIDGSGDAAFDRSAILAVNKAESFPELKNLPTHVFEKNFRVFNLNFEPEDLRQ